MTEKNRLKGALDWLHHAYWIREFLISSGIGTAVVAWIGRHLHIPADLLWPARLVAVGALMYLFVFARRIWKSRNSGYPIAQPGNREAAPQSTSRLQIHYATYEAIDGSGYDVAEFLRGIITGDSLVLDIENHNFVTGEHNFVPKDPKPSSPKWLRVQYSYDHGPKFLLQRPEHSRLVLPEDSFLKERASVAPEPDPNAIAKQHRLVELGNSVDGLFTPLQVRAWRLANEIQAFYEEVGPEPEYPRQEEDGTKEGIVRAFAKRNEKLHAYRERLEHGFELRFAERTKRLVHEFAEKGIQNSSIRITQSEFPFLGIKEEKALPSNIRMLAFLIEEQRNSSDPRKPGTAASSHLARVVTRCDAPVLSMDSHALASRWHCQSTPFRVAMTWTMLPPQTGSHPAQTRPAIVAATFDNPETYGYLGRHHEDYIAASSYRRSRNSGM